MIQQLDLIRGKLHDAGWRPAAGGYYCHPSSRLRLRMGYMHGETTVVVQADSDVRVYRGHDPLTWLAQKGLNRLDPPLKKILTKALDTPLARP